MFDMLRNKRRTQPKSRKNYQHDHIQIEKESNTPSTNKTM